MLFKVFKVMGNARLRETLNHLKHSCIIVLKQSETISTVTPAGQFGLSPDLEDDVVKQ